MFLLIFILIILVSIVFLTLLEQKGLRYIQLRKGPNKVGFIGLFQPFSDAVKLFSKEYILPVYSNYFIYYLRPRVSLGITFFVWLRYPFIINLLRFDLTFLYMFRCLRVGVYPLMISG